MFHCYFSAGRSGDPGPLASLGLNSEPCCCLTLVLGQMKVAAIQKRATVLLFINEFSFSGSSPLYFDNTLDKRAGISIINLLTVAKSAHIRCWTSWCTEGHGVHCDLPAPPLHPHSQDYSSGSHTPAPCCYLHCSQVWWPPQGTRVPQSTALHPEIMNQQFLPLELAIIISAIITWREGLPF